MSRIANCNVCGEAPVTSTEAGDGAIVWLCPNHLADAAFELYEELRGEGWEAPPRRTVH